MPKKGNIKNKTEEIVEEIVEDDNQSDVVSESSNDDNVIDKASLQPYERIDCIIEEVNAFRHALQNLAKELKEIRKDCKSSSKKKKIKKAPNPNAGVMKKYSVPKNVTDFLGVDEDEEISRKDLLTGLCNYIKDNNLQNPEKKTEFDLDAKMKTVLCKKKNKETKEYESLDDEKLKYTQIMGGISYWFDQSVDHSTVDCSET